MSKRLIKVLSLILTLAMFLSISTTGFALGGGDIGGGWDRDIGEDEVRDFEDFEPEEEEEELDYFQALDEETLAQVTVEAPMGALPTLAELRLESIPTADLRDAVDALVGGSPEILLAMDISFWLGDDEIEPEEPVRVRITSPELEGKSGLQVIHFPDNAEEPETVELIGDEDLSFALGTNEVAFRADSFSTYVVTWDGEGDPSAEIVWGYNEEDTFTPFKDTVSLDSSAGSMSLDLIFDGYMYSSAVYTLGSTEYALASPILTKVKAEDNSESWTMQAFVPVEGSTTNEKEEKTLPIEDGAKITVTYVEKTAADTHPASDPTKVKGPITEKEVTPNGDGTYKIHLDITGQVDHTETRVGANVIVIMDRTQSMSNTISGSTSRMAAAKTALNTLIDTLNPGTGSGQNLINFTAVDFANSQNYVNGVNWTSTRADMESYVTNLSYWERNHDPDGYGTCWQAGLYGGIVRAKEVPNNDNLKNNKTYIIFVTDGNPNGWYTGTNTDGGPSNRPNYQQSGSGQFIDSAYDAAIPNAVNASALCDNRIYGIFCGSSADMVHLQDLMNYNGSSGQVKGTFIDGTSEEAIINAFKGIAQTIVNDLGSSNVGVDDGIPQLANVSAAVSGEAGGFTYYITYPLTLITDTNDAHYNNYTYTHNKTAYYVAKNTVEATTNNRNAEGFKFATGYSYATESGVTTYYYTMVWDGAPSAGYSTSNGVTWDLSTAGVLADKTIYSLEFDVWPSQDAYDLLANLNNNMPGWTLDKLDDDTLEQLVVTVNGNEYTYTRGETAGSGTWSSKTASGTYPTSTGENSFLALIKAAGEDKVLYNIMTNTHLLTSYDYNGTSYTDPPKDGLVSGAMLLEDQTIGIVKYWHNDLDAKGAADIYLTITRDQKPYMDVKMGPATKVSDHEWMQEPDVDLYISCGIMTVDSSNNLTLNTTGHDYSVIEKDGSPWYWDLTAYTYHPMVVNSKNTMLILITEEMKEEEDFPTDITDTNPGNLKRVVSTGNGKTYYRFDNKLYVEVPKVQDEYGNDITNVLRADNDRRSNLEIAKTVTGSGATGDELFTFEFTMNNPTTPFKGDERYDASYHTFWFVVLKDLDADPEDPAWDDIALEEDGLSVEGANAEILELRTDNVNITDIQLHEADENYPYDYITYKYKGTACTVKAVDLQLHSGTEDIDGETNNYSYYSYYTGYYWFDNLETAQKVTAKIKGGWKIGFTSVTKNTVYTVEEPAASLPDGFQLVTPVTSTAKCNRTGETATAGVVNEDNPALVEGTIDNSNSEYRIGYTNRYDGYFYVYHSSDCTVERFLFAKNGAPIYTEKNYFDITALVDKSTYLYGGYYEDYAGKSASFDATALEYDTDNKSSDEDGSAYTTAYINDLTDPAWDLDLAYETNGMKIVPTANTVYYLKEVPAADFLQPKLRYTYRIDSGAIGTSWLFTNLDDENYSDVGFSLGDTGRTSGKHETSDSGKISYYSTFTIVPTRIEDNAVTYYMGKTAPTGDDVKNPKQLFTNGHYFGYLLVYNNSKLYNDTSLNVSGDVSLLTEGMYVFMFWITPDGLVVTSTANRTYTDITDTAKISSGTPKTLDSEIIDPNATTTPTP